MKVLTSSSLRVLLLISILFLYGCSKQLPLAEGVDAAQAYAMIDLLAERGIDASVVKSKTANMDILVGQNDMTSAMGVLRDHGFPRPVFQGFSEMFKQDGLIASAAEERARLLHVTTQKLEQTLSNIDGVISATVHPALSERGSLMAERVPPSASVFIKHRPAASLSHLTPDIQRIVASAIPGLKADMVSVMLLAGEQTVRPAVSASSGFQFNVALIVALITAGLILAAVFLLISRLAKKHDGSTMSQRIEDCVAAMRGLWRRLTTSWRP